MQDKFNRAYNFVYRHRGTFGYMAGIGVACVVITHTKQKPWTVGMQSEKTAEELAKMLVDHRVLSIVNERGCRIIIAASDAVLGK